MVERRVIKKIWVNLNCKSWLETSQSYWLSFHVVIWKLTGGTGKIRLQSNSKVIKHLQKSVFLKIPTNSTPRREAGGVTTGQHEAMAVSHV